MAIFQIKKGKDISLKGAAEKKIVEADLPQRVALQPSDFCGLKARVLTAIDQTVKVGTPVLEDKINQELVVVSPVSGKVVAINRGEKRALLQVVIETDGQQEHESFTSFTKEEIQGSAREDIIAHLLKGGVWPCLRQRPFSKIAHPQGSPKSIFVQAVNTEPLALDVDIALNGNEEDFQGGLDILKKLTEGSVHLCFAEGAKSKALTQAKNVETHQFSGPHPAGNVSTLIHYVDPINKGDVVWYVRAEDVLRIGRLFSKGEFLPVKYVALTGEGVKNRVYKKTVIGAPLSDLVDDFSPYGMRCLSGSILTGTSVGPEGFVCFYDSQVTMIPEGGHRDLIGWLLPGFNRYSFSKTVASSFLPESDNVRLDTDENGGHRAIVLNHLYDKYVPLEIMTYFLIRAVVAGDVDEAEKLGILECDEEDFALATFACPSKTDVGAIIRQGLEVIEREG